MAQRRYAGEAEEVTRSTALRLEIRMLVPFLQTSSIKEWN
jgi:hypothetical protein